MTYWSQAWQDEFVNNLLNFKRNGHYLDVGSFSATAQSNSYFFESEMGWKGICVEMGAFASEYKIRNCHFINMDATLVDYKKVLAEQGFPARIDYLSVDIDENSAKGLKALPLDDYRFSVITIEHDAYRFGNTLRSEERSVLEKHGYACIWTDVLVPLGCGMGPNLPFEDWWVDPAMFNMNKLLAISGSNVYPDETVAMLKGRHDVFVL